eukprot:TRINITY_DN705_c0_g2_i1.p1 TRINITY_DN705_c0_g2~~TRINITY_DN705_c0_g2_i1.p1  ORF type:complete len:453 (+),score=140.49 TRINITY_DN705_c0_g2_i1:55-1359(+)
MAWGRRGISDLLERVRNSDDAELHILPFRSFGDSEAIQLCEVLTENTTLKVLTTSGRLTRVGAEAFAEMLKTNSCLTGLAIGNQEFGDEAVISLMNGLKENSTLESLNLEYKGLTEDSAVVIGDMLATSSLKEFKINRNAIKSGVIGLFEGLKENSSIEKLDISEIELTGDNIELLCTYLAAPTCKLQELRISDNILGAVGGEKLGVALNQCSSLRLLEARNCELNGDFAASIRSALENGLEVIDFSGNPVGSGLHAMIPDSCKLKALHASGAGMNEADDIEGRTKTLVDALATCSELTAVTLDTNHIGESGSQFSRLTHIRFLSLMDNQIGQGCIALANAIVDGAQWQSLCLSVNSLSSADIIQFCEIIKGGSDLKLTSVELFGNEFDDDSKAAMEDLRSKGITAAYQDSNPGLPGEYHEAMRQQAEALQDQP